MRPLVVLAALGALTIACGGNAPTSPTPPLTLINGSGLATLHRGFVRATVDDNLWESSIAAVTIDSSFGPASSQMLLRAISSSLTLTIVGPLTVGTYDSGGIPSTSFSVSQGEFSRFWLVSPFINGTNGALTITTATPTRVAGTFSFTAGAPTPGQTPATRFVTNGTFDLSQ